MFNIDCFLSLSFQDEISFSRENIMFSIDDLDYK